MKSRSICALCVISALAGAAPVVAAQQSKPSEAQKAPPAAAKAEKKPNIVVFKLSGTPKPTQKRERPKDVPRFRPLSKAEKLKIAQVGQGLPHFSPASLTSILSLNPGHMTDATGYLILCWPRWAGWDLAFYTSQPIWNDDLGWCGPGSDNRPGNVAVTFQAQAGYWYMVDFFVFVAPMGTGDNGLRDFEVAVGDLPPSYETATVSGYGSHLVFKFPADSSRDYVGRLRLKPLTDSDPGSANWGPWFFIAVEVSQFSTAP